jgi:predicted ATP-dependent serine protease
MSSFKKATKASDGNKLVNEGRMSGVKPWVNGLSLVSSGIRELDDILGGGHVLGSTCLMHEDSYSNHAETVLLYSLAEAISQKHKTLLIVRDTHEAKAILSSLPFNMNKGSLSLDKKKTDVKTSEEEEDDKKRHLKIAWQYGKYIQGKSPLTAQQLLISLCYERKI